MGVARSHRFFLPPRAWALVACALTLTACASSGAIYDNYCTVQGVDTIIPVDVYISGCPPRPEAVLDALIKIQDKIAGETVSKDRHNDFKGILG